MRKPTPIPTGPAQIASTRGTTVIVLAAALLIAASGTAVNVYAQSSPYASLLTLTSQPVSGDTTARPVLSDSLSIPYRQTKSPTLAMALSAVVPGAGQVYNGSFWKVPIIWGVGGWFVYEWLQLDKSYRDYLHKYQASITTQLPNGNPYYLSSREFYRDERDGFAWYFGILYALNILDAYVDASLYDFNRHASLRPLPQGKGMAVRFSVSF